MKHPTLSLVLAVALVLAAVQLGGCKRVASAPRPKGQAEPTVSVIVVRGLVQDISKALQPGQTVKSKDTGSLIGTVESVVVTATKTQVGTADGRLVAVRSPLLRDFIITVKGSAVFGPDDIRFENDPTYINHQETFITPRVQFVGLFVDIHPAGQ